MSTSRPTNPLTGQILFFQKLNCFQDDNAINNNFQSDLFSDPIRQPGPPTPPAPVTLFQWQLEQEEQRVAGMSAELLSAQDTDGDTYVGSTRFTRRWVETRRSSRQPRDL